MKTTVTLLLMAVLCVSISSARPQQAKPNPARNLFHALFIQGAQREGIAYNELGPHSKRLWDNFLDYLTEQSKKTPMMDVLLALQGLQSISLKNPTSKPIRITDKHNAIALDLIRDFVVQAERDNLGIIRQVGLEHQFKQFKTSVLHARHIRELAAQAANGPMSMMGLINAMKTL